MRLSLTLVVLFHDLLLTLTILPLSALLFGFYLILLGVSILALQASEKLQKITATVDTENKNLNQVNEKIKQKQIGVKVKTKSKMPVFLLLAFVC
jgi:hypothetical protein